MKTTRRSEAAWIEARSRWQINVQKDGQRKTFTSSTPGRRGKHAAEAKADAWLASGTSAMRFDAAFAAFLEHVKRTTSTPNFIKHEQVGRLYLLPTLAARRLASITPALWQSCLDAMGDRGLSRKTIENARGTVTAFLRFARLNRYEYDRLEPGDLTIPRSAAAPKVKKPLTSQELHTLFTVSTITRYGRAVESPYIHAWRFLVVTGLRRGELCALRTSDITDTTVTVSRSTNSLGETTPGKTANARRTFALTRQMREILAAQSSMLRARGILSPYVFPDTHGEALDPNALYDRWYTYRAQHHIDSTLHELRHTYVSYCKTDMPLELLKSVVGHSKSMDTTAIYGHTVESDAARAAQIAETIFDDLLK